jgi:hypothetical protein
MSLTVAAPSITDWMSGIGAVLGVIATIAVGVLTVRYTVKAVSRMRISATSDSAGHVKVEISNTGKDAIEIHEVDFIARGWWAARLLRKLLFQGAFETTLATATPSGVVTIEAAKSCTWRMSLPRNLTNWPLPPTLLHPLSTRRKGTISRRRLVLRIYRGQNHRARYRWYSRTLRFRTIKRVSHPFVLSLWRVQVQCEVANLAEFKRLLGQVDGLDSSQPPEVESVGATMRRVTVVVQEWDETTAGKRAVEMASKASLAVTDGGAAVLREVESVAG